MRTQLKTYLKSLNKMQRAAFAQLANTSVGHLSNLVYNDDKFISPQLALALEIASGGQLKAEELCPDFDWKAAARGRCEQCNQTN